MICKNEQIKLFLGPDLKLCACLWVIGLYYIVTLHVYIQRIDIPSEKKNNIFVVTFNHCFRYCIYRRAQGL